MAVTTFTLKSNVWVTLDDVKDHLKIKLDNTDYDNRLKRLINSVVDMMEKYIQGPIKERTFIEFKDGDNSNTIVPNYYPARSVTELRIDMNRVFGTESIIPAANYILRGDPDPLHASNMKGSSIIIRDDSNSSIMGRLFTGSVSGSIKLTYVAGWGADYTDMPGDLTEALFLGIEYFYLLRENRELGVKSKTNGNQNYSRDVGLPKEVTDILDQYTDYTFGGNNSPQKNMFPL